MPSWFEMAGSQWVHEARGGIGMPETLPEEIHPDDLVLASSYTTCGVSRVSLSIALPMRFPSSLVHSAGE